MLQHLQQGHHAIAPHQFFLMLQRVDAQVADGTHAALCQIQRLLVNHLLDQHAYGTAMARGNLIFHAIGARIGKRSPSLLARRNHTAPRHTYNTTHPICCQQFNSRYELHATRKHGRQHTRKRAGGLAQGCISPWTHHTVSWLKLKK